MLPVNQFFDIIKKQGATGVLALWLWYTHSEVQELKSRLYECYGKDEQIMEQQIQKETAYAIIPEDYIKRKLRRV